MTNSRYDQPREKTIVDIPKTASNDDSSSFGSFFQTCFKFLAAMVVVAEASTMKRKLIVPGWAFPFCSVCDTVSPQLRIFKNFDFNGALFISI